MKQVRHRLRTGALAAAIACGLVAPPGAQALNVVWAGGDGLWTSSINWIGGAYPNASTDWVYIDGGALTHSTVTLNSSVGIGRLYIDAGDALALTAGSSLTLYGGQLVNEGRLSLASSNASRASIVLAADTTLSGGGTTWLSSDGSYRSLIYGNGSRTLTIAGGHTLRGAGDLGNASYGMLGVVNRGLVIAEGGTLSTYGGFDNSAGVVQVASGATLSANGISGGSVQSLGDATLAGSFSGVVLDGDFASSSLTLANSRIANTLRFSGGTLYSSGTLTVNGQLQIAAASNAHAMVNLAASTTLAGSGTTVLSSSTSGYRTIVYGATGRTLTVASGHTLRGAGDLGSGTYGQLAVVNQGTVIAEGGTLNTYGGFDNSAGVVQVASGATLSANGIGGGTVQSLGDATLAGSFSGVVLSGNFASSSLTLTNSRIADTLRVGSGTLYSSGTLTMDGQLQLAAASNAHAMMNLAASTTLAGSGTTVLSNSASGYHAIVYGATGRVLTVASGHTLRGAGDLGSGTYGQLAVVNQGTVIAEGGTLNTYGGFDNSAGVVQVASGATLSANGISGGNVQSLGDATLAGSFSGVVLDGNFASSSLTLINSRIADTLRVSSGTMYSSGTLTMDGQLQLAAASNSHAMMNLAASTTLAGSGTTVLSNSASGYHAIVFGSTGRTLTVASGHTLRGAGDLGSGTYGQLAVVNQGTVIAEGGTLTTYGSFDNSAGLIQVAGGATLSANGISGGTVQSLGDATLSGSFAGVALAGDFKTGSLTLANSRIANTLRVSAGSLSSSGTLTVEGQLQLAGSSAGMGLMTLAANTTLAGAGTTVLSNDASGYRGIIAGSGSRTLSIAASHTVRGAGDIGNGTYGSLLVNNAGTVIAEGGTLSLMTTGTGFDNTAGLVQIADGALLTLSGSLNGGTLQGLGDDSRLAGTTYRDLALTGTLRVAAGNTASVAGAITNTGTLTLAGSSNGYSMLSLAADATLSGNGSIVLGRDASGYGGIITSSGSRTVTLGSGQVVRGSGWIGNATYGALAVVNQGTVIAEGGTLTLYPGGGKRFDNTNGLVQIASGASLLLSGDVVGGTLQGLGATSTVSGSTLKDLTLAGALNVAAGSSLAVAGNVNNLATLTLAGSTSGYSQLTLAADTTLSGTGTVVLGPDASGYSGMVIGNGRTLTIAAGQTLRGAGLLGSATYGALGVVNQGTVLAEGGTLSVYASSLGFDNRNGTLVVAAGSTLSFASAPLLGDASLLRVGVTGSSGNASVGLFSITGNAAFDGQVVLDLSGYTAAIGDSFSFASYSGSYSGMFDAVSAAGYELSVSYTDHLVTATITAAVPEPQTYAMLLGGIAVIGWLARRRRARG